MLYEAGDYLNRNGRHRHAYYIISNSEILGYTPQQRRVIAAIARYLGKSRPTIEDGPVKALDPAERASVQNWGKIKLLVLRPTGRPTTTGHAVSSATAPAPP